RFVANRPPVRLCPVAERFGRRGGVVADRQDAVGPRVAQNVAHAGLRTGKYDASAGARDVAGACNQGAYPLRGAEAEPGKIDDEPIASLDGRDEGAVDLLHASAIHAAHELDYGHAVLQLPGLQLHRPLESVVEVANVSSPWAMPQAPQTMRR